MRTPKLTSSEKLKTRPATLDSNAGDWSLYEAVEILQEPIGLAIARGYSYKEIADLLSAHGIKLSAFEIREYLGHFKQKATAEKGQIDSAIPPEGDPTWEIGKNPVQTGLSNLSESHDLRQLRQFTAIIEREGDGYISLCPKLDIASQGNTVEEAKSNLAEALGLFFEVADPLEIEQRLRSEVFVTRLEIAVG